MDLVFAAARVLVLAVFAVSALEKLRAPTTFQAVLRDLGLARVRLWWLLLCVAELSTAVSVVTPTPRWLCATAVVVLGSVFAIAGLRAWSTGRPVTCSCFGQVARRPLGASQLYGFPLWVLLAIGVAGWQPTTTDDRAAIITAAIVLALPVHGWPLVRLMRRASDDRLATTGGANTGRLRASNDGVIISRSGTA